MFQDQIYELKAVIPASPELDSFFFIRYQVSGIRHPDRLVTLHHSVDINNTMLNNFFKNSGFSASKALTVNFFLIIVSSNLFCQTKTNLEVFYSLTDSLVDRIVKEIPDKENQISLTLNLGQSYPIFSNNIKDRFREKGKEILEQPTDEINVPHIDIVLEYAAVEYGEMYKDGWFGAHYVPRQSAISGNYLQSFLTEGKNDFEISVTDTVKVEDIKYLENESFSFTKGTIPAEPFISGLAEPLIAIGTAAAVVVLFFTIRSE